MKTLKLLPALAAAALLAGVLPAAAENWGAKPMKPVAAASGDFAGKHVVGYFVKTEGACRLTLMIDDAASNAPVSRVQVSVAPGSNAALDSADGKSLRFACQSGAQAMNVAYVERLAAVVEAR
jgi:hypothetical protein